MEKPEGYPEVGPHDQDHQAMAWPSAKNDMSLLESGVLGNYYNYNYGYDNLGHGHDHHQYLYTNQDHDDYYYYSFEEEESNNRFGKWSDPRLLALAEFSRELYFRRRELSKELFPHLQDQFHELFKKSGMRLWRVKSGNNRTRFATMQRSLSLGSPRRNEWIKVRTINTGGAGGDPQGLGGSAGQGGGGSK